MLSYGLEVPAPSQFVSHEVVDEIAAPCNQAYRAQINSRPNYVVDMDRFLDLLEVSTICEDIEEPEGATLLACYDPDDGGLVTINRKHEDFFKSRPDVYAACLGHEAGHCVLRHLEQPVSEDEAPLLIEDLPPRQRLLHKSTWYQYGLSQSEVRELKEREKRLSDRLVRKALVSEMARETLEQMRNRFEPIWMFRQAEHFSLCLRIPRDRLFDMLEEGWDFTNWGAIYRLAERFRVSGTMMRVRLEKLDLIEVGKDGKPRPKPKPVQAGLFH
jgi:hypothetical protein